MRLESVVFLSLLLSASHQHEVTKRESGGEKRIVCYYTNWSVYRPGTAKFNPQNINPYLCTHLIYAFGGLDRENGLRPYDKYQDIEQGGYAKFTGLKTYNKALKTMLAIGGWNEGSARFSPLVADEDRRKEFVKNVVKFLRINHFDGLDLDWEYPAYRDGGKPRDKENYALLVQELREEFEREADKTGRPRLLLTMAVPAGIEYIDKGYDIPKLNKYLDFMNILSYDYHSAFEPSVNHHSPLYSVEEESEYNFDSQLTIDATVKHYLLKGADAEKLVLGIPTYGRSYTLFNEQSTDLGSPSDGPGEQGDATREKGYLAYYEICANVKDGGWNVVQPKETALGPYAFKGNQWVGYDDEGIVKRKSQYVNERNLGGIMFWSIDNDDFRGKCHSRAYPLIEAAKEALLGSSPVATSNKLPSSPRGGKGTQSKVNSKLKNHRIPAVVTTTTQTAVTQTTPDPPTTPDPGSDFVCKDEGFFPHPRDCKKYFWCLDSGPSNLGIVAHQFTCPSGLFFNKAADSCDFARNVICKKKSGDSTTTTTTTTSPAKAGSKSATTVRTTTTTTTTTTEAPPEEEEEYYEEQEDPQTIKQLISLIKKLGGVAELEKQLEGSSPDVTTPAISKSLYERVINKQTTRYQPVQRNGPTGPQNEGIVRESGRSSYRKEKPSYVTIRRERPTTERGASVEYEDEAEEEIVEEKPKYTSIQRNRGSQIEGVETERPSERNKLKYQTVDRFRPRLRENSRNPPEENVQEETVHDTGLQSTPRYTNIFRSRSSTPDSSGSTTSKYITLQRQRPQPSESEDLGTTENELIEEDDITEERIVETTTTTLRPRVKVSEVLTTTPGVLTSTRVVTKIVEGATKRQKVPLHMYQQFLKDSENFVDSVTQPYIRGVTLAVTAPPSLASGFRTRKPIIITTTVRTTPAYIALRRNRLRTTSTTEALEASTKSKGFIPSRTRGRTTTEPSEDSDSNESSFKRDDADEKPIRGFSPRQRSTTESSQNGITKRQFDRTRFSSRRVTSTSTTEKPDEEDKLFTREFSRDTNVIRRPLLKPRFPGRRPTASTTTTKPSVGTQSANNSTSTIKYNSTIDTSSTSSSPTSSFPSTTGSLKFETDVSVVDSTTSTDPASVADTTTLSMAPLGNTSFSSEMSTESMTSSDVPVDITTPAIVETTVSSTTHRFSNRHRSNAVEIISFNETTDSIVSKDHLGRNRTKIILRRKRPTEDVQANSIGGPSTHRPITSNRSAERRKPEPVGKSLDITDEDYGFLENSVSSTTFPPKARGRTRFATSIKDELEEDQTTETSRLRSRTTTDQGVTRSRPNSAVTSRSKLRASQDSTTRRQELTDVPKSRARDAADRGTTVGLSREIDSTESRGPIETRSRQRTATTRRYQEISRKSQPTESREARSRSSEQEYAKRRASPDSSSDGSQLDKRRQRVVVTDEGTLPEESTPRTRTLRRGQKKFNLGELVSDEDIKAVNDELPRKSSQPRNLVNFKGTGDQKKKLRTVVLRKTVKDLAVGESGIPGQESYQNSIDEDLSSGSDRIYESLLNDDLEIVYTIEDAAKKSGNDSKEDEIQNRSRRPFSRRPVTRSTTTTSTELPTTQRQRTTVQILRQRLNRFKSERGQSRGTTSTESIRIEEEPPTTTRPRKSEFRRVIRPSSAQALEAAPQLDSSIEQSMTKDTVTRTKQFHRETTLRGQQRLTTQAVPRTEYPSTESEEPDVVTIDEHTSDADESIPDLANVAVAAIQSLATSAPTNPTEQYFTTTTLRPTYRELVQTTERGSPRPTRPHRPLTTPALVPVVPVRGVVRSSPRPFSKVLPGVLPLKPRPISPLGATRPLYDDYDDFYAEPVDIPLSGKVRIHNDGYIECLDIGNFPHPFSCRKFISCAKMENGHLLGWEYTCPKGLSFDPIGGICNWNAGLGCKE